MTSSLPGPTDTEFFERAGMLDTMVGAGPRDDPAEVARDGFAVMAGRERVVSASLNSKLLLRLNPRIRNLSWGTAVAQGAVNALTDHRSR